MDNQNKLDCTLKNEMIIEDACRYYNSVLFDDNTNNPKIIISLYNHCEPVDQNGPTCGLVALIMALRIIEMKWEIDENIALILARSFGITKYGELFSAENFSKFISEQFSLKTEVKSDLETLKLEILIHLCKGLPVLVPYDIDPDNEIWYNKGESAHWAVLTGFCIVCKNEMPGQMEFKNVKNLCQTIVLGHLSNELNWTEKINIVQKYLSDGELMVYAREGHDNRVKIYKFKKLCLSNRDLHHVGNHISNDMIIPEDGIIETILANQCIFIYKE